MSSPANTNPPRVAYTPTEVAEMLGCNVVTLYRYIHDGLLPARKMGVRRYRITQEDIDIFLSRKTTAKGTPNESQEEDSQP